VSRLFGWIVDAYALLATFSFGWFLFVWAAVRLYTRDARRAVRIAMDATTAPLAGSVYGLSVIVFGRPAVFFAAVLVLMLLFGWMGNAEKRATGRVRYGKLFRAVWRAAFLLFAPLEVGLLAAGLWKYASGQL